MSIDARDQTDGQGRDDGLPPGSGRLLARAALADVRAARRLAVAIDDLFIPDAARLDDRLRLATAAALAGLVATIEAALRRQGAQLLAARGEAALAARLAGPDAPVLDRLAGAGLVRDPALMRELIARVRQDVMTDALPATAPDGADAPSLLNRLADHDGAVGAAAVALLAAESRRRAGEAGSGARSDLPARLHRRLVWGVAAALRERYRDTTGASLAALDHALAEAAQQGLAAQDEGERLTEAATRLAAALDPPADALPALLVAALGDRRLALFVALLGHAMGIAYEEAREIVLDPAADRLWLVLRALELGRDAIAGIGLMLSEADPRRDVEALADALDDIAAIPPARARAALAPLTLHPDYRAAMLALAQGRDGRRWEQAA